MSLLLKSLDEKTRNIILDEVNSDINNNRLYLSTRLNAKGKKLYPQLLVKSIKDGDDSSLAKSLGSYFNATETKKNFKGEEDYEAKMSISAPELLAEGEFKHFYMRALCILAIGENKKLRICRVRYSEKPRPKSKMRIGKIVDANKLLIYLRKLGKHRDNNMYFPPNFGLGIELIDSD